MAGLTDEEKNYIITVATKEIDNIAKLHGANFFSFTKKMRKLLIETFIAGALMAINITKKHEKNEH